MAHAINPAGFQKLPEPTHRGGLRLRLGSVYFRFRRYAAWHLSKTKYTVRRLSPATLEKQLPHVVYAHKSPLRRGLRNIHASLENNKIVNLRLAVERLNGVVLQPGHTLSLWRCIGRPSKRRGFQLGMILVNGSIQSGYGGGLCQLSNLIYWLTLHTPLVVTERYRHQYDVFPDADRTLPFGSGATIAYNYIDLQVRNDTKVAYGLSLWLDQIWLYGLWRSEAPVFTSYEVYEKNHRFTQHPTGKYVRHNEIWRIARDECGEILSEEMVTENHALMMYSPLLPG